MSGGEFRLHMCGITTDGKLWHTSRGSVASWNPWEEIKPAGANNSGPFISVACVSTRREVNWASTDEELHILGITQDGKLLHTSRLEGQVWQPFEDLTTRMGGNLGKLQNVGGTQFRGVLDICVIVLTKSGEQRILHSSRDTHGAWANFEDVNQPQLAGLPGAFISADCARSSGIELLTVLQVCGVTNDGKLWHTLHYTDPPWLPFANVQFLSAHAPDHFANVSIAEGVGGLHVCAQANGDLWHTFRSSADAGLQAVPFWQAAFDNIKAQAGNPGSFGSVSCATIWEDENRNKTELHVCGATSDGKLWHTLLPLTSNPPVWQPFEEVTTAGGNPGSFGFVCITDYPPWWGPIGGGGDLTCFQIWMSISNDDSQIGALQGQRAATSNRAQIDQLNQQIAGLQQNKASLQQKARKKGC